MSCNCGGRAVALLRRLGYVLDPEAGALVRGADRIPVRALKEHPTRLTLRALGRYLRGGSPQEVSHGTS